MLSEPSIHGSNSPALAVIVIVTVFEPLLTRLKTKRSVAGVGARSLMKGQLMRRLAASCLLKSFVDPCLCKNKQRVNAMSRADAR